MKRFWEKIEKTEGCWIWKAARSKDGYGRFSYKGKNTNAHRVAYLITYGEIPEKFCVLHKCDNPPCVNPDHLFIGDHMTNVRDMINKGRNKLVQGTEHIKAKLTEEQVIEIRQRFDRGSIANLSKEFGISRGAITGIVYRRNWKHI